MDNIINSIKPNKRKPYWYKVDINGEVIDIHYDDLSRFQLSEKNPIKGEYLLDLRKSSAVKFLYDKAIQKIAMKLHSKADLYRHLAQVIYKDFPKLFTKNESQEVINSILDRMSDKNYLDDKEFSVKLIEKRMRQNKPLGLRAILQELYSKGVKTDEIEQYLKDNYENNEIENARKYVRKFAGKYDKNKIIMRLLARGFDYDTALKAVSEMTHFEV